MTANNAQGVGVLAVMDRDAEHANRYRCTALTLDERQAFPLADVGRFAKESDAAYAAVAELVEAARDYSEHPHDAEGVNIAASRRLRAALAKFTTEGKQG